MARRLTRDTRRAALGGVAAGFANYFDMDPVLVRLAFILLCFLNGIGLLFYIICWVVMPRDEVPAATPGAGTTPAEKIVDDVREAGEKVVNNIRNTSAAPGRGQIVGGIILIVIGTLFLLDRLAWPYWFSWMRFANLWPIVVIVIGIMLILQSRRGRAE